VRSFCQGGPWLTRRPYPSGVGIYALAESVSSNR
jgi:hypothetical protein